MQLQLVEYMKKNRVSVLLMQETRTPQTTQYIVERYLFIVFGSGEGKEYAGVGFVVGRKARRAIKYID
eukprot:12858226-Alexandrium_andersonii.AAC.1